ncbi:MAG: fasciclin [Verrucomicrobiales bacterium]|nr:fasciclin [Verrucomicrobiales bacterium]
MKNTILLSLLALGFIAAPVMRAADMKDKTVVEIAAANDSFKTLVTAVKAAGLAEALSGDGPFTIFAPTDEAFKKIPADTLASLLKPENKEKLASILKYHVVSGKVLAADVKPGKVATLQGSEITIKAADGKVMVNDATVTKTDIVGKNGVIHVIDTVIMPK